MDVWLVRLRVRGRGCGSCVVPVKAFLLKRKGVIGVHVVGYTVYVLLKEDADPSAVLEDEAWRFYSIEDYSWEKTRLNHALQQIKPPYSLL